MAGGQIGQCIYSMAKLWHNAKLQFHFSVQEYVANLAFLKGVEVVNVLQPSSTPLSHAFTMNDY